MPVNGHQQQRDTYPRTGRKGEEVGIEPWQRLDSLREMVPALRADNQSGYERTSNAPDHLLTRIPMHCRPKCPCPG